MTEDICQDGSAGPGSRKDSSVLLSRYWLLFNVTLVSTGLFLYYRIRTHNPPPQRALDAADKDHAALLTEVTRLSDYVAGNLHAAPKIGEAAVQMGLVVLVTWLWFYTFRVAAQLKQIADAASATTAAKLPSSFRLEWPKPGAGPVPIPLILGTISTLPALLFAGSMHEAYQPAVFVMALVAVFVAAEHYGGLREQSEQLTEQLEQLTRQRVALETTRSELSQTQKGLESIQRATETLLNFEGLARFKADVYKKYAGAKIDISAVVRFYDIDPEWWECGKKPAAVWATYLELYSKEEGAEKRRMEKQRAEKEKAEKTEKEKEEKETLIGALTSPEYLASTTFVSDLPLPLSREWNRRLDDNKLFRDLLGMTWQLVVLEEARRVRARRNEAGSVGPLEAKRISAYVGSPSSWMHVVDSTVFQVIWRDTREKSSVRELTVDVKPELRRMVCKWAHDDIQRNVGRASRAEEYIVAALRFAAYQLKGESEIVEDQVLVEEHELSDVLGVLGMSKWLEDAPELDVLSFPGDSRVACGRQLCVSIFREFLLQRWDDLSVSISPRARPDAFRFKHLTLETL